MRSLFLTPPSQVALKYYYVTIYTKNNTTEEIKIEQIRIDLVQFRLFLQIQGILLYIFTIRFDYLCHNNTVVYLQCDQDPQLDHSGTLIAHDFVLHCCCWIPSSAEQSDALVATQSRARICIPPPHEAVHGVHEPHVVQDTVLPKKISIKYDLDVIPISHASQLTLLVNVKLQNPEK